MIYELLALSSSGDSIYDLIVSDENNKFKIKCNCVTAEMGIMCKHRIAVITGNYGRSIDTTFPENKDARLATELIASHGITQKYLWLTKELENVKRQFKLEEKAIKIMINALAGD